MTPDQAQWLVLAAMLVPVGLALSVLFALACGKAIAERDRREAPAPSLNDVLLRCER